MANRTEPVTFAGLEEKWRRSGTALHSYELDAEPTVGAVYDASRLQCADDLALLRQRVEALRDKWRNESAAKHWTGDYIVGRSDARYLCADDLDALLGKAGT